MWLTLAFLVAILTSIQDILLKRISKKVDVYIVSWGWWFFSLPFFYLTLFVDDVGQLSSKFWIACFWATVIVVVATIYMIKALKSSDLSLTVPMMSLTPVLLLITSPIMLNEFPKWYGVAGVVLIGFGSYLLNFKDRAHGIFEPFRSLLKNKGTKYMMFVAVIFSVSANIDKIGVLESSPFVWMVILSTTCSLVLGFIMVSKSQDTIAQIKVSFRDLLFLGFLNALTLIVQMIAIVMTQVPYLIAIKRTSAIMSALYGFIFLKEKGLKERMIGIILMVLGVFMISFS